MTQIRNSPPVQKPIKPVDNATPTVLAAAPIVAYVADKFERSIRK